VFGLLLLAHGGGGEVPPFTPAALFTKTDLLQIATLLLLAVAGLYGYGVWRLAKAGHRWPIGRSVGFGIGLAFIAIANVSGLAAYEDVLLSAHMVQHMLLAMIAPIFLALGAPVTLALRTLPPGGRRVLLSVLHSRVGKFFTFPLVSFALFIASPFVLYFSGLYQLSLENAWVHDLVHLHFLIVGCLFLWPLIGLDPVPGRMSYPLRALVMFLSTPFHTVLGLTVMQSSSLIAGPYYQSLALSWSDPHSDQQLAGGILWAGGEIVSVAMLAAQVVQWMRHADREARRIDRALDRQEALERAAARAAADGGAGDDADLAADLAALDEVDAEAREPVDDELTLGTIDAQVSPEHRRNIR
jgi:putative copper resistance protein D